MEISEATIDASSGEVEEIDALIIDGGFAGVDRLMHLREQGFNAKFYDRAAQLGGIWYWNRYPGARVDTTCPLYQYSREDLWRDWLLPRTSSWWFGTNIPGKESEPLYYAGGLPRFLDLCWASANNGYEGLRIS